DSAGGGGDGATGLASPGSNGDQRQRSHVAKKLSSEILLRPGGRSLLPAHRRRRPKVPCKLRRVYPVPSAARRDRPPFDRNLSCSMGEDIHRMGTDPGQLRRSPLQPATGEKTGAAAV